MSIKKEAYDNGFKGEIDKLAAAAYYCPKCDYTSNKGGICPKCGATMKKAPSNMKKTAESIRDPQFKEQRKAVSRAGRFSPLGGLAIGTAAGVGLGNIARKVMGKSPLAGAVGLGVGAASALTGLDIGALSKKKKRQAALDKFPIGSKFRQLYNEQRG